MSAFGRGVSLLGRIPTVVRTLRPLRAAQLAAQLRHVLFGLGAPARVQGPAPRLAVDASAVAFLPPAPHVGVEGEPGARRLRLLGLERPLPEPGPDWEDTSHGPLFAYHLHEHAWLRHAALAPAQRIAWIDDWIARHPRGTGWDPHPISLRLLAWGKLLLSPGALAQDGPIEPAIVERLARSMADQAETLARGLEIRLQANHLLSNRIGVVWAGWLFEGEVADGWRAGTGALLEELDAQVAADGGHEERSPMYHALLLEGVLDLLNLGRASARAAPAALARLEAVATRMLAALAVWTGPDGRLARFADSAEGVAAAPAALVDYAARLGLDAPSLAPRPAALRETGYARLVAGPFDALVSLAGPSPPHQPGHAHCDALALDLHVAGVPLLADTGVYEYRPGPLRDRARATASHATLVFDGREQSEVWSAHRVGGRARVRVLAPPTDDRVEAEVTGWSPGAPTHRRRVRLEEDAAVIEDDVPAPGHDVVSRLPLAPGWQVGADGEDRVATHEATGRRVRFDLPAALDWRVESAPIFPTFHASTDRPVLVGRGRTPLEVRIRIALID